MTGGLATALYPHARSGVVVAVVLVNLRAVRERKAAVASQSFRRTSTA